MKKLPGETLRIGRKSALLVVVLAAVLILSVLLRIALVAVLILAILLAALITVHAVTSLCCVPG